MRVLPTFRSLVGALVVILGAVLTLTVGPDPVAAAASAWPAHPAHQRIAAVTPTSFTVVSDRSANARAYRLFASTVASDVWYANLEAGEHTASLRSVRGTSPRLTLGGLRYSTSTWYVRLQAINGSRHSYADEISTLGLRPGRPRGLEAHSTAAGTWLTWAGGASTGYDVQQATDARMTRDLRSYRVRAYRSAAHQFTPPARSLGRHYYWRVRAWNHGTRSGWTTAAGATVRTRLGAVRVMTYNLLNLNNTAEPDGTPIAPWTQRAPAAATAVLHRRPDVLGVEEGAEFVDAARTTRQVQSLVTTLNARGNAFAMADTTRALTADTKGHWSGNYIVYDTATVHPVGAGGYWTIDDDTACGHSAVFQEFERNDRPVRFLFVVTHMPNGDIDAQRRDETATIVRHATGQAGGLPIVYGGDFNSYPEYTQHPLDGPQVAMAAAGVVDTKTVARQRTNAGYNTINGYHDPPLHNGVHIDYLWLSPGVAATDWRNELVLGPRGRFPGVVPSDHNPVDGAVLLPY